MKNTFQFIINKLSGNWILFPFLIILFFVITNLQSCATIKAPSGGPKDTTPPELIRSEPPQGTTGWTGGKIRLFFSEYMSEASIERAFTIAPKLKEEWSMDFKGDVIEIDIQSELELNRTYIVTINRDLKDEHGVPIEKGFQIAFSTGNTIYSGELSGRVFDAEKVSVHLWEWRDDVHRDSVYIENPEYIADAGDDGEFLFQYLSPGRYCILAVGRESAGEPFGLSILRIGVPTQESFFVQEKQPTTGVIIKMKLIESPLKLTRTEIVDNRWGRLMFNKSVKGFSMDGWIQFIQNDSVRLDPEIFQDPQNENKLVFLLDSLISDVKTIIESKPIIDEYKVVMDSVRIKIKVPSEPDTTFLNILEPKERVTVNPDRNGGPPVNIILTRPIKSARAIFNCNLIKEKTDTIPTIITWENPMVIKALPIDGWEDNSNYSLVFESLDTLRYLSLEDTIYTLNIITKDRIGYGNLIGNIAEKNISKLSLDAISIENSSVRFPAVVYFPYTFEINTIPSSKYKLFFYEDSDGDEHYSYGEALPFKPSEWFHVYPDTIDIRANWDFEMKNIKLGMD